MKARLSQEEKERLRDNLSDQYLYSLLHSVCPKYERSLCSVRPSTEEILQNAVEIFEAILGMESDEAANYSRGLYDNVYCSWRETSEVAGKQPTEDDLAAVTCLVLYPVYLLITWSNAADIMQCSLIISEKATDECRDKWEEIEAAFKPQEARALRGGLGAWVLEYLNADDSLLPADQTPVQHQASTIQLRIGNTTTKRKGNKVKFMRIIMALYRHKFFELPDGGDPGPEAVFKVFGNAVGDDYSDYASHIYSGGNHNINQKDKVLKIFDELRTEFEEYMNEREE